ncbi:MAG TPA: 16S rRNA (uracil(1498)-N(3))-methyltransferase [Pyrinomonadaceae bacterium]
MHRFFAPAANSSTGRVILDAGETRHLRKVIRLVPGDAVAVFDGQGNEFLCEISTVSRRGTELFIKKRIEAASPESTLDLTLAAAMLKGEKFDLVVQKAVELGVHHLVALRTARTDVRSKESTARLTRWRKIALEASKQSGRAYLMSVEGPVDLAEFLQNTESKDTLLFSERSGESLPADLPAKKMTAIIGPEGGWDDVELENAKAAGVRVVTLGGRIMRAETAAIAVTTIIQHRFGDLN